MSCALYQITQLPIILSDIECHFSYFKNLRCLVNSLLSSLKILGSWLLYYAEHVLFVKAKLLVDWLLLYWFQAPASIEQDLMLVSAPVSNKGDSRSISSSSDVTVRQTLHRTCLNTRLKKE